MGDENGDTGRFSRRQHWEQRYGRGVDDAAWFHAEAPAELLELAREGRIPTKAALDLGCGVGVSTAILAEHCARTVGVDIAHEALVSARERIAGGPGRASFVVADAVRLPFPDRSFTFVFDRGCMQNIDRSAWPAYFQEVDRLLAPGGRYQLFASRVAPGSRKGLKPFLRRLARRGRGKGRGRGGGKGGDRLPALVKELLPTSMRIVETHQRTSFTTKAGRTRVVFYALIEKG